MPAGQKTENENALLRSQRDKTILDSLIVVAGFGLCRSWIVFCLAAPFSQAELYSTNWIFLLFGALVALAVALIVRRLGNKIEQIRRVLFLATGVALVLSAIIIPISISERLEIMLLVGFVIGGAGAGMLQILWGERFAHYKVRFATIVAPAAAIVTALLVSVSSAGASVVGYIAFPLLSFILLLIIAERSGLKVSSFLARFQTITRTDKLEPSQDVEETPGSEALLQSKASSKEEPNDEKDRKTSNRSVAKLMFSIMTFSFLCRVFDAIPPSGPDPFGTFGGSALMSLIFVGAAFLLFAAILKDRFNPTLTYRLSLPLMVAGFVAIALFFDTHAALSILLINIGYEFFDILTWILFTDIARRKNQQPLHIFGLGVAFMFIGMTIGLLGGEMLTSLMLSGSVQITVIAMLSILSLVVVAFLVIPEGTIQHLTHAFSPDKREVNEEDTPNAKGEGRHEEHCAQAAKDYRLTPRESEVLVLLAYGRTLTIISRDLHIAKGTARTHIENIYRKLDVHKQQELIDLIEDYEHQA